jgi:calcium/calmodulin-dependent protein kinase I
MLQNERILISTLTIAHSLSDDTIMGSNLCRDQERMDVSEVTDTEEKYAVGDLIVADGAIEWRRCTSKLDGKKYTAKIVDKGSISAARLKSYREEARIMRILDHPHVVKCFDAFEDERKFYLVEECMLGGLLFDRIAAKRMFTEAEAGRVLKVLLSAIEYCHRKGILHHDLKLENLVLADESYDATIKLNGFSFAIVSEEEVVTPIRGSLDYIAPEILMHNRHGKAADMWSIGIITYMLLGGRAPFQSSNDDLQVEKTKQGIFKFDHVAWWDISDDAKDFIRHLIVVDPSKRYTAAQALSHKWVCNPQLKPGQNLSGHLTELQDVMKQRRYRGALDTVVAINRFKNERKDHFRDSIHLSVIAEDDEEVAEFAYTTA